MRNATHGYSIIEIRNGRRIAHFEKRSAKTYELARIRIIELNHDRRYKQMDRRFEIWDGINPISVIKFTDTEIIEKPYLLPPRSLQEGLDLEKDYTMSVRNRLKNQTIGKKTGDLTSWILQEAGDRELCKIVHKSNFKSVEKTISRTFSEHGDVKKCFTPGEAKSQEWLTKHGLVNRKEF